MPGRISTIALVTGALLVAGVGYWAVKVRQRADAAAVSAHVRDAHPGATVGCESLRGNGSVWACATVYRAESLCELAKVSLTGSISLAPEPHRCARVPRLAAMAPPTPTAAGVAADVTRTVRGARFACVRPGQGRSRWVCGRRAGGAVDCRVVRVLPWQPLKLEPGGSRCSRFPVLGVT